MKASSLQGVKLSKQPGCQGHVSVKGDPGVDLGGPGALTVLLLVKWLLVLLVFEWSVLTGPLNLLIRRRAGTDGALPAAVGQRESEKCFLCNMEVRLAAAQEDDLLCAHI